MDRRGFLKVLGIGGAALVVAPKLVLPPMRNVVAAPERKVFLPPREGRHFTPADDYRLGNSLRYLNAPLQWDLRITKPFQPVAQPQWDRAVQILGVEAVLVDVSIDWSSNSAVMITERYSGAGTPPDPALLRSLGDVVLDIHRHTDNYRYGFV